jgi:hypothetical protein
MSQNFTNTVINPTYSLEEIVKLTTYEHRLIDTPTFDSANIQCRIKLTKNKLRYRKALIKDFDGVTYTLDSEHTLGFNLPMSEIKFILNDLKIVFEDIDKTNKLDEDDLSVFIARFLQFFIRETDARLSEALDLMLMYDFIEAYKFTYADVHKAMRDLKTHWVLGQNINFEAIFLQKIFERKVFNVFHILDRIGMNSKCAMTDSVLETAIKKTDCLIEKVILSGALSTNRRTI